MKAVLVVGGGIAGLTASLALAEAGFLVYLLESAPQVGGQMASVYYRRVLNTGTLQQPDSCKICSQPTPELAEALSHPGIELLAYSELTELKGEAGSFQATIKKKPGYVLADKCNLCGECVKVCPVSRKDLIYQGEPERKAIYPTYFKALPQVYTIDKEICTECGECVKVCKPGAIELKMEEQFLTLELGAVLSCPGYSLFNPGEISELGFGRYPDVITSAMLESKLFLYSELRGELYCPSDKRKPEKVAFIQCVGSRDLTCGGSYCSAVCCLIATKEAMMVKEHYPEADCTVFYIDLRMQGKDYEEFLEKAKRDYGVKYKKIIPLKVVETPPGEGEKGLLLRYEDEETGELVEERFDLVVLGVGFLAGKAQRELAEVLGIELNRHGFSKLSALESIKTSRAGIYAAGCFTEPKAMPEAVVEAQAAAGEIISLLGKGEPPGEEKAYPPERELAGELPRVGVLFLKPKPGYEWGFNLKELIEFGAKRPDVVMVEEHLLAGEESSRYLKEKIKEFNLNRLLLVGERLKEEFFRELLREEGLNPYLLEKLELGGSQSKEEALKLQLRVSLAKLGRAKPLKLERFLVNKTGLVLGGGLAGMTSALSLSAQGFPVVLVEREDELGGNLNRLYRNLEGDNLQGYLAGLLEHVEKDPKIKVYLKSQLKESSGFAGNFVSKLKTPKGEEEVKHGVMILATGGREYRPKEFLYGEDKRVLSQWELEELLARKDKQLTSKKTLVMVQCVGSRNQEHPYCSRVCCGEALKNALWLKELYSGHQIYFLHKDVRSYGFEEEYYLKAREQGVVFLRFHPDMPPQVTSADKGIEVLVYDSNLRRQVLIPADFLVLASGIVRQDGVEELAEQLKLPLNRDGFWAEANPTLEPVEFERLGVYLCGLAHSARQAGETAMQAKAAAQRAGLVLAKDYLTPPPVFAVVDEDLCASCLTCVRLCQYQAPFISETGKARVEVYRCQGCGVCVAECPTKALSLQGLRDEQVLAMLEELLEV